MRVIKVAAASVMLLTASSVVAFAQTEPGRVYSPEEQGDFAPPVDVWLDQASYNYGDRIRPYFTTEPGAYVTVIRVTTDGKLRVLYPRRPSDQRRYFLGQLASDRIPYNSESSFNLYESSGTGFVFAIASYSRFDFAYFASGGQWNTARLANTGRFGDPFEIMRKFIDLTLSDREEFSMDYVSYQVYSQGHRSRYATRYLYSSFDDYFDRCIGAFGFGYGYYCRTYGGYYGRYYDPYGLVVVIPPRGRAPSTRRPPRDLAIKPLVPDPLLPTAPVQPPAQGRVPANNWAEVAAAARRDRVLRSAAPRTNPRTEPFVEPRQIERDPRVDARHPDRGMSYPMPRTEPRVERRVDPRVERIDMRSEPRQRVESAPVGRVETRSEPRRVEVRSEPRPQPQRHEHPRPQGKEDKQ